MGARRLKSKKQSDTSSEAGRPEPVTFFIDECLGKGVSTALEKAGAVVRGYSGNIAIGTSDKDWLARVGKQNWVVLTKDKNIRHHIAERDALIAAKVKAFVLTSGNLTGSEMADIFVANLDKITARANETAPPFIAKVTRNNVVELYKTVDA